MSKSNPLRGVARRGGVDAGSLPRTRRRPGAAAAAYSHALSILREPGEAELVAAAALRRGGHSRVAVIAHARHLSLARASTSAPTSLDELASPDPRVLALQLAGTRPAIERSIVDLELRYGLDARSFGRSIGLSSSQAIERSREITKTWANHLDPAMMALLGPGTCEVLAHVLANKGMSPNSRGIGSNARSSTLLAATGTEPVSLIQASETDTAGVTIGNLIDAADSVTHHAAQCETCGDRLRLMTSVRTLVGQVPLEPVPASVATAARASRRRLAGPFPSSIEPRAFDGLRAPWLLALTVTAAVIVAVCLGIWLVPGALNHHDNTQARRVERLLQSAPESRLLGTPTIITPDVKTAALANNGTDPIIWHATTSALWLKVSPSNGELQPAKSISLDVTASSPPPNSSSDATITIAGDDGSKQTLRYDPNGG